MPVPVEPVVPTGFLRCGPQPVGATGFTRNPLAGGAGRGEVGRMVLDPSEWRMRRDAHFERVSAWTGPHRERAARGEKHPVWDFLFEYYAFRPAWLERWHPGPDTVLRAAADERLFQAPAYRQHDEPGSRTLAVERLPAGRREFIVWLLALLRGIESRPAFYGCHGLHEWAMVYRQPASAVRHAAVPLRFTPPELAAIVESLAVRCSHFDAFRFFTAAARSLNRLQPDRPSAPALEQGGCLHANMDLYKWSFKLAPLAPSEWVADAFELARDIREVDMRASPYDLAAFGFAPIPIETPAGRDAYEARQREFAQRAVPIRSRLIALCARLLQAGPSGHVPTPFRVGFSGDQRPAGDPQEADLSRH